MIRPIVMWPDERLSVVSEAVDINRYVAGEYNDLIADMFETMSSVRGVGIGASQVGVPLRIFVMSVKGNAYTFVNPVIRSSEEPAMMSEGCLSVPGFHEVLERRYRVKVQSVGVGGSLIKRAFWGQEAQCVQHEIDHLDGKTMPDYVNLSENGRKSLIEWLARPERASTDRFLGPVLQRLKDQADARGPAPNPLQQKTGQK